jgi:hypothetical protein
MSVLGKSSLLASSKQTTLPPHSHNAAHPTVMMMMIVQCCSSGPQCFRTEQKFKLDLHGQGLAWSGGWSAGSTHLTCWAIKCIKLFY